MSKLTVDFIEADCTLIDRAHPIGVEPSRSDSRRVLIAGLGNVFLGDSAFGLEIIHQLTHTDLPLGVESREFGTELQELALSVASGYDTVILITAMSRGCEPGTLFLLEPRFTDTDDSGEESDSLPVELSAALSRALVTGIRPRRLFVLGCEPNNSFHDGRLIHLSRPVGTAIPNAIQMLWFLLRQVTHTPPNEEVNLNFDFSTADVGSEAVPIRKIG